MLLIINLEYFAVIIIFVNQQFKEYARFQIQHITVDKSPHNTAKRFVIIELSQWSQIITERMVIKR